MQIHFSGNVEDFIDEFGSHPLYFRLGYFSLIGLLRLHTLLGDYFQALKAVTYLEFDPKVSVRFFIIHGRYNDFFRDYTTQYHRAW